MTRRTSKDAYDAIQANGLLSQRRWEVYDYIYKYGPVTAKAAWRHLAPDSNSGVITTRFSELKLQGVVVEVGEAVDKNTGMKAILWDVTENLPIKLNKTKSSFKVTLDFETKDDAQNWIAGYMDGGGDQHMGYIVDHEKPRTGTYLALKGWTQCPKCRFNEMMTMEEFLDSYDDESKKALGIEIQNEAADRKCQNCFHECSESEVVNL